MRSALGLLRRHLGVVLVVATAVVVVAGAAFVALESDTVDNFGYGLWWAVSLMSTVGFVGDAPQTTGGRVLSGFLMIGGFALMSLVTATVSSLFVRQEQQPEIDEEHDFEARTAATLTELTRAVEALTDQQRRLEAALAERADPDQQL